MENKGPQAPAKAPIDDRYYKLLHELQAVDFVLVELNLYLDTHPSDVSAIAQYNQFAQKRMQLSRQYEELYGPLLNYGHSFSRSPFEWSQGPWPWQV
ncbi:spore coat protein CotJB [Paenibacillus turpanensis]|uniref:spore coat protein CotJB n=1 Tax=Paenibacillus turpanensis TaxID=2689078 RepID=UPI001409567B|nr:spore coat protein CotJB [Paenibacillus turpanensis]